MPVLLIVSSAGGYWLSRRALCPVDQITATARSISIRNLAERLPAAQTGDELDRLTETFNAMLVRLESAVNQIRQFTGDASHELRSPLSFVRTVAEVALRNPKTDKASRQAFQDIVEESSKAAVLLDDMLTLARADADRGLAVMEPLDLSAVIEEVCDSARPLPTLCDGLFTEISDHPDEKLMGWYAAVHSHNCILVLYVQCNFDPARA